ncbi:hypothetical protein OXYTRIMIC_235 [Oxytricha trifallax]|uniref:PHD-type domain-containing protein n=1 Tax=Oxytricha trifallax TaxID=1172189 RepID=A0A073HZK7_9SPIT|nr:hypothetical protein OXYTRIMIC_235 [Oxytricha trifallax]
MFYLSQKQNPEREIYPESQHKKVYEQRMMKAYNEMVKQIRNQSENNNLQSNYYSDELLIQLQDLANAGSNTSSTESQKSPIDNQNINSFPILDLNYFEEFKQNDEQVDKFSPSKQKLNQTYVIDEDLDQVNKILRCSDKQLARIIQSKLTPKSQTQSKGSMRIKQPPVKLTNLTKRHREYHCICQNQYDNKEMIQCEGPCKMWYHPGCLKMSEEDFLKYQSSQEVLSFYCEICEITSK